MKSNRKNYFLIAAIIGALSVSVSLGGMLAFRSRPPLSAAIGNTFTDSTASSSDSGYPTVPIVPRALTDNPANSLALGVSADTVRYYESQTGRAFQVTLPTRHVDILSDKKLPGFVRTIWASDKNQVVSIFTQTGGAMFNVYNYATKKTTPLSTSVMSVAFSPNGQQLAFLEAGTDRTTLSVADSDGANARKILDTRATGAHISWPLDTLLVLESQQPGGTRRDLTIVTLDGSLVSLLSGKTNLECTWSRDGSKLLYSYFEKDSGVHLWYLDMTNRVETPLTIATSARKCAWHPDNVTITCGVPSNTELSRDVSATDSATSDDIFQINTLAGTQQKVYGARSTAYIGVIDPLVSSSASYFVFTNLFDQRLYSLDLSH